MDRIVWVRLPNDQVTARLSHSLNGIKHKTLSELADMLSLVWLFPQLDLVCVRSLWHLGDFFFLVVVHSWSIRPTSSRREQRWPQVLLNLLNTIGGGPWASYLTLTAAMTVTSNRFRLSHDDLVLFGFFVTILLWSFAFFVVFCRFLFGTLRWLRIIHYFILFVDFNTCIWVFSFDFFHKSFNSQPNNAHTLQRNPSNAFRPAINAHSLQQVLQLGS